MSASPSESASCLPGHPEDPAQWFKDNVQPHEPALRSWLRGRFPSLSDIDDLVQETYARLFHAKKPGQIAEPRPYMFAIARNAVASLHRRRKIISFEALVEDDRLGVAEDRRNPAEAAAHEQELAMLAEAIRVLPRRCREILTLRKLGGLSHREIAIRLGISENTVNAQAALGVLRCREYFEAKGVRRSTG